MKRLLLTLWTFCLLVMFISGLAGWKDVTLIFAVLVASPLILVFLSFIVRWIVTGKIDDD